MTKKKELGNKGQLSLAMTWLVSSMGLLLICAVIAPFLVDFNTQVYQSSEFLWQDAKISANKIQDENIRTGILNTINTSQDSQQTNIDINAALFQYGWVILLIVSAGGIYLYVRKTTEIESGGGLA